MMRAAKENAERTLFIFVVVVAVVAAATTADDDVTREKNFVSPCIIRVLYIYIHLRLTSCSSLGSIRTHHPLVTISTIILTLMVAHIVVNIYIYITIMTIHRQSRIAAHLLHIYICNTRALTENHI